jgi:hypothetical protein
MGSYLTAYISSPWGSGQFRPAVVIPAVFSTLFGPMVGVLGAAVGTLIVDSAKHGQIYVRSLVSAVPGNFLGFYLFGRLVKRFSWENYVKATQISLLVSNAIVAFLYVYFRAFVEASYPVVFKEGWIYVSLGLVAWWYVTMLPFVLLIGPPLIRAVASAFPGIVSEQVRSATVKGEALKKSFSLAMIVPGAVMLLVGVGIVLADPDWILALNVAPNAVVLAGMEAMFIIGGVILIFLGLLVLATGRLIIGHK